MMFYAGKALQKKTIMQTLSLIGMNFLFQFKFNNSRNTNFHFISYIQAFEMDLYLR